MLDTVMRVEDMRWKGIDRCIRWHFFFFFLASKQMDDKGLWIWSWLRIHFSSVLFSCIDILCYFSRLLFTLLLFYPEPFASSLLSLVTLVHSFPLSFHLLLMALTPVSDIQVDKSVTEAFMMSSPYLCLIREALKQPTQLNYFVPLSWLQKEPGQKKYS